MRDRVERIMLHICKQLLVVCLPSSLRQLRHSLVKKGAAEDERRASSLAFPSCSSVVEDSQWILGRIQAPVKLGNGWGYDIGFGGLDHVLASGEDVNRRSRTPLKSISNEVSNHGIKIGMGRTQSQRSRTPYISKTMRVSNEEKKAVERGYWHLWHFNPAEEEAGNNGFHLDSKEPDWSKLLTA